MYINNDYILVADLITEGITDITLQVKKPSGIVFSEVVLEPEDFIEINYGYYNIKLKKELLNEIGTYIFRISSYQNETFVEKECIMSPISAKVPASVCIIKGDIADITSVSDTFAGVKVSVKPLKLPLKVSGHLIQGKSVITYTDYSGLFQVPVIRGATVLIEIIDVGLRFQAIVPDQDEIDIVDLIPQT